MQRSNIKVTALPGIIVKPKYSVKQTLALLTGQKRKTVLSKVLEEI